MTRILALSAGVALAAVGLARGEEVVYFQNGQAMRVEKTRREGNWLFMQMEPQNELAVLMRQVAKVEKAEPLPGQSASSAAPANVVSATGGDGPSRAMPMVRGRVSESYEPAEAGEEPQEGEEQQQVEAAQEPTPGVPAALQGRDLVPSAFPRGTRRSPNRSPSE